MFNRLLPFGVFLLCVLMHTAASAQSEGLEMVHSPNGKRALSQHAEKLAELQGYFLQSIEQPAKRFTQACERHLNRYVAMLDREVRNLTRAGQIEEAKAVQAMLEQARNWTITTPNNKGLHFLSKTSLDVQGSDKATKLGVDLLVEIESAGVTYAQQVQTAFDLYKGKVNAARQVLSDEMSKVLDIEQRAGRLDAVQEVQATIAAIQKLPEVERPEPASAQKPDDNDRTGTSRTTYDKVKIPEALVGFYSMRYTGTDRMMREALIEFRPDGCLIRGQTYMSPEDRSIKTSHDQTPVNVSGVNEAGMVLRFEESGGADVVLNLRILNQHDRTMIEGRSTYSYADGRGGGLSTPQTCYVRKLGYSSSNVNGFDDGVYIVSLDLRRDPAGQELNGPMKFKIEVTNGNYLITHRTLAGKPDNFEPCMPTVFRVRAQGGDVIMESEYSMTRQQEMFVQRTLQDGTKEMQLWWDRSNYHKGQTADAYGSVTKAD